MASATLMEMEAPLFTWRRHQLCRVDYEPALMYEGVPQGLPHFGAPDATRDAIMHRRHLVLICDGEGEEYAPLEEAGSAYLEFAALAEDSLTSEEIIPAIIDFAERYGAPTAPYVPPGAGTLYSSDKSLGMPLPILFTEVFAMTRVLNFLSATRKAEQGDFGQLRKLTSHLAEDLFPDWDLGDDAFRLLTQLVTVTNELNSHLSGVRLRALADVDALLKSMRSPVRRLLRPKFRPRYTCDDLLSAMWLQTYWSATERPIIRDRCKGCGRPFQAADQRQQYCDPSCRHATNQRDYYQRQKGGKR